jgi:PAS domain S-box-containing protein
MQMYNVLGALKILGVVMEYDARVRAVFDHGAVGFALIDRHTGNFVKVNKRFCDIVGLDENNAEGSSFMDIAHPDDMQENLHKVKFLLEGGLGDITMEKCFVQPDGSVVSCNLTLFPLWDIGVESDYYIAVVEDTTKIKSALEKLQKANDLLGQRVMELTAALETKTYELEAIKKLLKDKILNLKSA